MESSFMDGSVRFGGTSKAQLGRALVGGCRKWLDDARALWAYACPNLALPPGRPKDFTSPSFSGIAIKNDIGVLFCGTCFRLFVGKQRIGVARFVRGGHVR